MWIDDCSERQEKSVNGKNGKVLPGKEVRFYFAPVSTYVWKKLHHAMVDLDKSRNILFHNCFSIRSRPAKLCSGSWSSKKLKGKIQNWDVHNTVPWNTNGVRVTGSRSKRTFNRLFLLFFVATSVDINVWTSSLWIYYSLFDWYSSIE